MMEQISVRHVRRALSRKRALRVLGRTAAAAASAVCLLATGLLLKDLAMKDNGGAVGGIIIPDRALMDRYDMHMTNHVSDALEGVVEVEKVYWLRDAEPVSPEPDQAKFGSTRDPKSLDWLLEDAKELLDGQDTVFTPQTRIMWGSRVNYYLDETILSITWKRFIGESCYYFNEVKIAHPSQFRRFLADGQYGSERQYLTTQMAASVNAVSATNGDYYKYRDIGSVIYNGQVYRSDNTLDLCMIDDRGEMLLVQDRTFRSREELEAYVQENNVRFSLAFGPIMIEDHKIVVPYEYEVGEINQNYSRAALADLGDLHYLVVVNTFEGDLEDMPTLRDFARILQSFGCEKAYALDGGQTAVLVMNDKMISTPSYGSQRMVSDMIYFATAIPNNREESQ